MSGARRGFGNGGSRAGAGGDAGAGAEVSAGARRGEESNGGARDGAEEYTSLHRACIDGNQAQVIELLEARSDFDYVNARSATKQRTSLMCAARAGHTNIVEYLLQYQEVLKGISLQDRKGKTALHIAAFNGRSKALMLLLEKADDSVIDIQDSTKTTVLMLTAKFCSPEAVTTLLNRGASLLITSKHEHNALHHATRRKKGDYLEVIRALLQSPDAKKALKQTNSKNKTTLHLAASRRQSEALMLLLEKADDSVIDIQDSTKTTVLMLAAKFCSPEAVTTLLNRGASLLITSKHEHNALHHAARRKERGYLEVIEALLELPDADEACRKRDSKGRNPADFAEKTDIKKRLDDYLARRGGDNAITPVTHASETSGQQNLTNTTPTNTQRFRDSRKTGHGGAGALQPLGLRSVSAEGDAAAILYGVVLPPPVTHASETSGQQDLTNTTPTNTQRFRASRKTGHAGAGALQPLDSRHVSAEGNGAVILHRVVLPPPVTHASEISGQDPANASLTNTGSRHQRSGSDNNNVLDLPATESCCNKVDRIVTSCARYILRTNQAPEGRGR